MNKALVKKAPTAFANLGSVLGEGFGDLMAAEGDQFAQVSLDDILREPQVRDPANFDDEEHSLADLSASIRKHGVLEPVLLCPIEGFPQPYKLVFGERRYIGSQMAGKDKIPALIRKMTAEEVRDIQFAENIHRKNLTLIEEAKRIQQDLDSLGSIDAVLDKHNKSRAWLSKILSLLKLPQQAKRLLSEKISADMEVIGDVKTIEKLDPKAAEKLVNELKATRGKEDARKQVKAVKEAIKPPSAKKIAAKEAKGQGGTVATAKDRTAELPGVTTIFADAKKSGKDDKTAPRPVAFTPAQALSTAYVNIFEHGSSPKTVYDVMPKDDKEAIEGWLHSYYDAGTKAKDAGRAVIQGFRNGQFSSDGEGAFALVAFLHGADSGAKFNLLNILGSVKE